MRGIFKSYDFIKMLSLKICLSIPYRSFIKLQMRLFLFYKKNNKTKCSEIMNIKGYLCSYSHQRNFKKSIYLRMFLVCNYLSDLNRSVDSQLQPQTMMKLEITETY